MGVIGLNGYVKYNIEPKTNALPLVRQIYEELSSNRPVRINSSNNLNNNGINFIIDASAYFYYLLLKINWFVFDILDLLNLLKKQLHYFLSIQNLQKIIFVFDGVNSPLKAQTENERRIKRISSINKFFNQVTSYAMPDQKNIPKTLSPSPLVHMTFMQFLNDASKIHSKIKIEYCTSEADSYISNLANKYNGYVISNDSDFFIYKTPGYINIDSLEFPNDTYDFNYNFSIKYKLYTRSMILNHFSLTDDTIPIFATLCGNDYLKIDENNYSQLKEFFKCNNGNKSARYSTNSIHKNIYNFILNMKDKYTYNEQHEGITPLQNSIIEKICNNSSLIEKYNNSEYNDKFKSILIESVRQYNNENNNGSDDSSISTDILNSYKSGNFYYRLLNVPIKNQFICSNYLEDIHKESCWNITKNMRKKMYGLIISRNLKFLDQDNIKKSETIKGPIISRNLKFLDQDNIKKSETIKGPIISRNLKFLDQDNIKKSETIKGPIISRNLKFLDQDNIKKSETIKGPIISRNLKFLDQDNIKKSETIKGPIISRNLKFLDQDNIKKSETIKGPIISRNLKFLDQDNIKKSETIKGPIISRNLKFLDQDNIKKSETIKGPIISRNLKFLDQDNIKKSETIKEIGRTNSSVDSKEVSISPSYHNVFDYSNKNKMFIYYLTLFDSNKNKIKALPYYLIPVVSSLSDQIYTTNMASTSTKLYHYEMKALLASSIAALTLTYLNISSPYLDKGQKLLNSLSFLSLNSSSNANNLTQEENIQKHDQMINDSNNYNNLYNNMKTRGRRSLQLKNYEEIKKLQKNSNQFKNAIHIYAEFKNILIMNSYMLQILKLTENFPLLSSFYSMYPYLWEGAYYSMIESFKCNNKKISPIFRSLFNIEVNDNSDNYLNKLEKIYSKMTNAILA